MKKLFKVSHFTILIPVEEHNEFLLYNILTGGLSTIDSINGQTLKNLIDLGAFYVDDMMRESEFIKFLFEKDFIVDESINENEIYINNYKLNVEDRINKKVADIGLTIGTTITCNMGCSYCFEFIKPNKSLKDDNVINSIINYLDSMAKNSPVEKWSVLHNCWYGGEPLINKGAIAKLTPKLLDFCSKHDIRYTARIITNGILLTKESWELLYENQVHHVQVTLDGAKSTHNNYRPLKNGNLRNYELILENLAQMPKDMSATIRVNVDRNVAQTFEQLLKDLKDYGIWPQRYKNVSVSPSYLRGYDETASQTQFDYLSAREFHYEKVKFGKMKVATYNEWAKSNNLKQAKLNWTLPEFQVEECSTWVSPYNFVIDTEGNIHKCWETIHESDAGTSHVSNTFDIEAYKKYTSFSRVNMYDECHTCKFLPICDGFNCAHAALKESTPPCTVWKTSINDFLLDQYLDMVKNPDLIGFISDHNKASAGGHRNR